MSERVPEDVRTQASSAAEHVEMALRAEDDEQELSGGKDVLFLQEEALSGLSAKQMAARRRLHQQSALLIEQDRVRHCEEQGNQDCASFFETETDRTPDLVYSPEDAPDGPPWRYEPTPYQRAKRAEKKERRANTRNRIKDNAIQKTPKKLKNPSDLQVRFRTGFIYILVTVICIMAGELSTLVYLMGVAGICAGEFFYMLRSDAKLPNEAIGITAAVLYLPATYLRGLEGALIVTIGMLLALLVWYVFWLRSRIHDVGVSFFGAAYTGLTLCGLVIIRQSLDGIWGGVALLILFLSVWANDAFAYLIGSKFGKYKLAPRTSPKKSWEGFIAGLVGSAVFWIALSFVPGVTMEIWQAVVFGIICGMMEVLGDLVESRIKRNSGFKDSGTMMPGHGGLLDRCDSLFLASVSAVILLAIGGCIPYVGM